MNIKSFDFRFIIAWIVLAILWRQGIGHLNVYVIDYSSIENMFRTLDDEGSWQWLEILADVIMPGAFVWLYARGVDGRPWVLQGVQFGLVAACVGVVPLCMRYHVALQQAPIIVKQQVIWYSLLMVGLGVVVAAIYRYMRRPV